MRSSVPLRLFAVFLLVYGLSAGASLTRHSLAPHFVYLAKSFLHGHLDLIQVPDPPYDLTLFDGRWYVSFPPLPSLLMLPLVAVGGLAVSDVAFSVVLGAFNVFLFHTVLQRLRPWERWWGGVEGSVWLSVLLGLGTPLWYCAVFGSVWYTAHVVAVTCLCLYAREVLGQNRPALTGLWLGLGFLARAPVILGFPLSLALGLRRHRTSRGIARFLILFAVGITPALLGQAAYNWARFGSPIEFGYRWMNSPGPLLERQATWGQFSPHFLPENLYTLLIRPPIVSLDPFRVVPDPWGMGLLFTCPALLVALRSLRTIKGDALVLGLWLSVALTQVPSAFYFNTGSFQFGYRFALDWLPLGILLVALGSADLRCGSRWWVRVLIAASVLMHLWGILWMYPNFNGRSWSFQYIDLLRCFLR